MAVMMTDNRPNCVAGVLWPELTPAQLDRLSTAWDRWNADPNNRALEYDYCWAAEIVAHIPYYRADGSLGNWLVAYMENYALKLNDPNDLSKPVIRVQPGEPEKENAMPTKSDLFPSKWLKTSDFSKPRRMKIEDVRQVEVKNPDSGKTESKPALFFAGEEKAMIINVTNFDAIAAITGSEDTDEWAGWSVVLFTTKVPFGKKIVDAIRVRAPKDAGVQPQAAKPAAPEHSTLFGEDYDEQGEAEAAEVDV